MFCSNCGKTVPDNATQCPYCGAPVTAQQTGMPAQQPGRNRSSAASKVGNGLGIAALILGALTILMNLIGYVAFGLAVAAIVQGARAKNKAPVVMGVVAIVLAIALIIVNMIFFNPFA